MIGDWQLPEGQAIPDVPGVPERRIGADQDAVLTGRKGRARVSFAGTSELLLDGQTVLNDLAVDRSTLALAQNPVYLERSLAGGLRERLFLPLNHAAALWQWSAPNRVELALRWNPLDFARDLNGRSLRIGNAIFAFDRDIEWVFEAQLVRASCAVNADKKLTLAVAKNDVATLRSLGNLHALILSRLSDWSRAGAELPAFQCSDQRVADDLNGAVYQMYSAGESLTGDPSTGLSHFLRDVLGFAPDAEKHRVVLAPRLPAEWSLFEANNLPLGDNSIALRFHRSGSVHTFALLPLKGAMPPRIVFEPAVPATGSATIHVDGVRADLDVRREGKRLVCPLQVVLDHERTIVIDADS